MTDCFFVPLSNTQTDENMNSSVRQTMMKLPYAIGVSSANSTITLRVNKDFTGFSAEEMPQWLTKSTDDDTAYVAEISGKKYTVKVEKSSFSVKSLKTPANKIYSTFSNATLNNETSSMVKYYSMATHPVSKNVRSELMRFTGATRLVINTEQKTVTLKVKEMSETAKIPNILNATEETNTFTMTLKNETWTVTVEKDIFTIDSLQKPTNEIGSVHPAKKKNGVKFFIKTDLDQKPSPVPATIRAELMKLPGAIGIKVKNNERLIEMRMKPKYRWPTTPVILEPSKDATEFMLTIEGEESTETEHWKVKLMKQEQLLKFEAPVIRHLRRDNAKTLLKSTAFFIDLDSEEHKKKNVLSLKTRNQLLNIAEVTNVSTHNDTISLKVKKNFSGFKSVPECLTNGQKTENSAFLNQFTFTTEDNKTWNVSIEQRTENIEALRTPTNHIGMTKTFAATQCA